MFLTKNNKILWGRMALGALVTAALVASGILWFDKPVFLFLRQFDCAAWSILGKITDGKVWIIASFIAVLVFCARKCVKTDCEFLVNKKHRGVWAYIRNLFANMRTNNAFLIFCSVLSAGLIANVLKYCIGRARPVFFEALDMTGFFPPATEWAFRSMPSGHATVGFAGLVMIGMLAPKYKPLTWTFAIIIGFSRVAMGVHWPSDVIFGAFIGMVVADIVKGTLLKK